MNDLATRGLRHAERLQRLGLWGLMPPPVYDALHWLAFSGVRLPPPLRDMQNITLTLDRAVNAVIDQRMAAADRLRRPAQRVASGRRRNGGHASGSATRR